MRLSHTGAPHVLQHTRRTDLRFERQHAFEQWTVGVVRLTHGSGSFVTAQVTEVMIRHPFGKSLDQIMVTEERAIFTLPCVGVFVRYDGAEEEFGQAVEHVDDPQPTVTLVKPQRWRFAWLRRFILRPHRRQRRRIHQPEVDPPPATPSPIARRLPPRFH
jgi:hypothetical protein